jgi:hypothetical protein
MSSVIKSALGLLGLAALGVACRGTLPPTEPPQGSPDGAPSMQTNDTATAGPLADEGLASPPATLPGPGAPLAAAEPGAGGTSVLPPPPPPPHGGTGVGGSGRGGTSAAGSGIR